MLGVYNLQRKWNTGFQFQTNVLFFMYFNPGSSLNYYFTILRARAHFASSLYPTATRVLSSFLLLFLLLLLSFFERSIKQKLRAYHLPLPCKRLASIYNLKIHRHLLTIVTFVVRSSRSDNVAKFPACHVPIYPCPFASPTPQPDRWSLTADTARLSRAWKSTHPCLNHFSRWIIYSSDWKSLEI